ncbi:probable folate-biopterin transporter 4 isoform X2 [Nymphaea colorata]|uniref:probable folate-biopterin transporter 4 isoform X2 n=1 Tax=Nymphaea colorata TaxID=210225 RepID=UPI00214F4734|nr:probable folate-biopterin transporter 4 isoform X2 [Nymphaea colorata]
MVSWLRQMRTNFGFPFLWLIVFIYFIQGFRSFVWMAVSFQLKDMLKLSPSTSQFLVSIAQSPWSIKPLYGILSDCIPIHGRKRLPYLNLATLLSLVPWLILGLSESLRSSSISLTIFLTIQNIGSAMADVVVDAMIAEAVRFERAAYAGDLQLISWSTMALGGISGSLLGGYSLTNMKIHRNYIIFSALNSIQLLSCAFVKEASFSSTTVGENTADASLDSYNPAMTKTNLSMEYAPDKESPMIDYAQTNIQNGKLSGVSEELAADLVQRERVSNVNAPVVETDDFGTMRRRKKTKEVGELRNISMPSEIVKCHKKKPLVMKWLLSLLTGSVYNLSRAVRNIPMPSEIVKCNQKKPLAMKWLLSLRTGVYGLCQAVKNIYMSSEIAKCHQKKPLALKRLLSLRTGVYGLSQAVRNICMPSEIVKRHKKPLAMKWLLSLRRGVCSLSEAFRQPIILRPMTWFFIAHVTVPNISISMFYYQTEFLHMDSSFVGTARVVGWCGLMLGSIIYSRFLKHIKLRRILMWAQVGLACLILFDIALVSRLNVLVGVSDKAMVLGVSALADAVHQLKLMPFLIISGRLCPPGIEGTLFAMFMSINNLGSTLSSLLGAGLASALHIQTEVFDNLLLANIVRLICSFIPITFLFLIPEEATGVSS